MTIEIDAAGSSSFASRDDDGRLDGGRARRAGPALQWTHFLVVFDGSLSGTNKLEIYADGVDITSAGSFAGVGPYSVDLVFAAPE